MKRIGKAALAHRNQTRFLYEPQGLTIVIRGAVICGLKSIAFRPDAEAHAHQLGATPSIPPRAFR